MTHRRGNARPAPNPPTLYGKEAPSTDIQVSVVTTGHLGRIRLSGEYERMGAFEDAMMKAGALPAFQTLWRKEDVWHRDGTHPWHGSTEHDEIWCYS